MKRLVMILALLVWLVPDSASAGTESSVYPWQLLSGGYNSSINDGRILPYPAAPSGTGFFSLVEDSIMTMTADNGGFSRSVAAAPCAGLPWFALLDCVLTAHVQRPGDVWENSNGGRGFTSSFCGGYASGCPTPAPQLGFLLAGPPSAMDGADKNYSPNDIASAGWPAELLAKLPSIREAVPAMCIAPQGLPDDQVNFCGPGLTYRSGQSAFYVSPDVGRQWYPLSASCGLPWDAGPDLVAADPGNPGHVVTARTVGDAGGCYYPQTGVPACAQRRVAWTGDISRQVEASIRHTADSAADPGATGTATLAVDAAGLPTGQDYDGWRYAALGHLAGGAQCDAAHAGMQVDCKADAPAMCHGTQAGTGQPHEAFCPDYTQDQCNCIGADKKPIVEANCTFPQLTSLAIDPRGGQVYAPSNVGLLYSPDGGRKWRRSGHNLYTRWAADAAPSNTTAAAEPWPYLPGLALEDEAHDPGVKILTMQGLPGVLPQPLLPNAGALDLNAQQEMLVHLSRVSIVSSPCPQGGTPLSDALNFPRARVRVTATLAAIWKNPSPISAQRLSGVFVAHGDSCTDAAAAQPLVFRDTANLMLTELADAALGL